jgi:Rieske Fe-S protein
MKSEDNIEGISRRKFLGNAVKGIGGIIALAVATPLAGYFLSPIWKKSKPELTPIGTVSQIPENIPTYVTYELRVRDGWYVTTVSQAVWAVNKGNGNLTIFDPRCTHLNCPYYWDDKKNLFTCPCHGGVYSIDGKVLAGPPPRPLDRLEYVIQDGTILLSGKIIRGT